MSITSNNLNFAIKIAKIIKGDAKKKHLNQNPKLTFFFIHFH